MADYSTELSQSLTTLYLQPADGFQRSTQFGLTSDDTHNFTGSMYVSGTLYANQYQVNIIDTVSGSTIFGNDTTDTHQFTGSVYFNNSVFPGSDNTVDLGSASRRWANIYTGDLHLKNDRGNWTIVEEEDYLCVINNGTGKKYKMMLQEIED